MVGFVQAHRAFIGYLIFAIVVILGFQQMQQFGDRLDEQGRERHFAICENQNDVKRIVTGILDLSAELSEETGAIDDLTESELEKYEEAQAQAAELLEQEDCESLVDRPPDIKEGE